MSVPPNFRWQQFLERTFPAYHDGKNVKSEEEGVVCHVGSPLRKAYTDEAIGYCRNEKEKS